MGGCYAARGRDNTNEKREEWGYPPSDKEKRAMEEQQDMTLSSEQKPNATAESCEAREAAKSTKEQATEGVEKVAAVPLGELHDSRVGEESEDSAKRDLTEQEEEEAQEDEEEPTEDRESITTMGFETLCGLFREKAKRDPMGDARREVQQIYEALLRQLKLQRDEERKRWLAQGGVLNEFVAAERPIEKELKEIYDAFQNRRRELIAREDDLRQQNLRRKREIIGKIEELTHQQEVKGETFNRFNELRKEWREIGQVPRAEAEDLYQSYSHQVQQFYDYVELNRELRDLDYRKNLEVKTELCERAEELMTEPDLHKAFKELQKLHARWKEYGPVLREKSDEIWERFSAASSRINQAYRDWLQERKSLYAKNLSVRKEIVLQMEELMREERAKRADWVSTTAKVMALQKAFKEAFPVARSQSNIGDVFFSMCSEFFNRRRAYEKEQDAIGKENVEKKQDLCLQAEALKDSEKWNDTKEELIALQQRWKTIGYTPRKADQQLWERFKAAQDYFFERRKEAFTTQRAEEIENQKQREALIAEVEAYQPGEDGKEVVERLKKFQTRWGAVGHVPMRSKESLYTRFRAALDTHYDHLRRERKEEYEQAYVAKLNSMAEDANGEHQLVAERGKSQRKLEQLMEEKNRLETNMSFFGKGEQTNPLLQKTRQDVERLEREIVSVKQQIKEINKRIRASKEQKDGGVSKEDR